MKPPIILSQPEASYCVIWLHGLGADGNDFVPLAQQLNTHQTITYVFPHAPVQPVTLNGGLAMPAWFDIHALSLTAPQDEAGIQRANQTINQLIDEMHHAGFAYDQILLAGFSQGGSVVLDVAMQHAHRLAGVLILSSFLLPSTDIHKSQQCNTPIALMHGEQDPIVPLDWGEQAYQQLQAQHTQLTWHKYPMGHEVCSAQLKDIEQWLNQVCV